MIISRKPQIYTVYFYSNSPTIKISITTHVVYMSLADLRLIISYLSFANFLTPYKNYCAKKSETYEVFANLAKQLYS